VVRLVSVRLYAQEGRPARQTSNLRPVRRLRQFGCGERRAEDAGRSAYEQTPARVDACPDRLVDGFGVLGPRAAARTATVERKRRFTTPDGILLE